MMNKPNPYSRASVNFSILEEGFKPADIYRFWCLSLFKDEWYNVHVTLKDIQALSGDKSLNSFNKHFKNYLDIKPYYIKKNHAYLTKRNVYHIPHMELECITLSRSFLNVKLDAKVKGFYIQLVLLEKYGNTVMTKANVINTLKMDKKTYDKYLIELIKEDLVESGNLIKVETSKYILENDFKFQKVTSKREWQEIAKWVEECRNQFSKQGIFSAI